MPQYTTDFPTYLFKKEEKLRIVYFHTGIESFSAHPLDSIFPFFEKNGCSIQKIELIHVDFYNKSWFQHWFWNLLSYRAGTLQNGTQYEFHNSIPDFLRKNQSPTFANLLMKNIPDYIDQVYK